MIVQSADEISEQLLEGKNIFLTGGAGVGKTYTTKKIIDIFTSNEKNVIKLASTAMAATHIGGQTLHSFFRFGISSNIYDLQENMKYDIDTTLKKLLQKSDLIIIDEISMVSAGIMEMIRLRLTQSNYIGALLVVGDFLQLPPVIKRRDITEFQTLHPMVDIQGIFGFAFESDAWELFNFEVVELTQVHRTDNASFMLVLNDIRHGKFANRHAKYLSNIMKEPDSEIEYTWLYARNSEVSIHNEKSLNELLGDVLAIEADVEEKVEGIKDEEIEKFCNDAKISQNLLLKKGAPVLFTRNSWNYYNGQKGHVINYDEGRDILFIEDEHGRALKVERESFERKEYVEDMVEDEVVLLQRNRLVIKQFPVVLGYALTIHKSQGMSLNDLVIDARHVFAPSQFYVALSRAISPYRLILIVQKEKLYNLIHADKKALEFYGSISEKKMEKA